MNITKFIKEEKFKAYTHMLSNKNIIKRKLSALTLDKAKIVDVPNNTFAMSKLEEAKGRLVTIYAKNKYYHKRLNFSIDDYGYYYVNGLPLFNKEVCISKIVTEDDYTKEETILFKNDYCNEPRLVQIAKVFGSVQADKARKGQEAILYRQLKETEEYYQETCDALNSIPTLLKESKPFISNIQKEEWEKTICGCASGMYHGGDIKAVIHCMKLLSKNASLDKVNAYLDDINKDSGTAYEHIKGMVIHFAPNGSKLALQDHDLIDAE